MNNLGELLRAKGGADLESARGLHARALAMREAVLGRTHVLVGEVFLCEEGRE